MPLMAFGRRVGSVGVFLGLSAETGTYALTGSDADLEAGLILDAEAATFTLTGADAALGEVPVWASIPDVVFNRGVASNFSLASYLTDAGGRVTLTGLDSSSIALPSGVFYSDENFRLEYDGTDTGSDVSVSGVVLFAEYDSVFVNGVPAVSDWTSRAAGALVVEDFSGYADTAELQAGVAFSALATDLSQLVTTPALTGKAFMTEKQPTGPTSGTASASWNAWLNGLNSYSVRKIYVQFVVYTEFDALDWVQSVFPGSTVGPKFALIDYFDGAAPNQVDELVIDNQWGFQAVTGYRKGSGWGLAPLIEARSTPANPSDFAYQNAIDRGVPEPVVTADDYEQRYGVLFSTTPRPTEGQRNTINANVAIGSALWNSDDHTVIEAYLDMPNDTIQIWAARYGEQPVLVHSYVGTAAFNDFSSTFWDHIVLTDYQTGGLAEPARPIMRRYYSQLLTDTNPIPFPSTTTPFDVPSHQGTPGLQFLDNATGSYDYGRLATVPSGFGDGDFTLELEITPYGTETDPNYVFSNDVRYGWIIDDNEIETGANPTANTTWWFRGNFLIDLFDNGAPSLGSMALQFYGSGRLRWLVSDGDTTNLSRDVFGVGAYPATDAVNIVDGQRHRVQCVRRLTGVAESTYELWIDQSLVASVVRSNRRSFYTDYWSSWAAAADGIFIGAEKQAALNDIPTWEDYKGQINKLRLWARAKSWEELRTGRNATNSSTVGLWTFDEGSGSTATDQVSGQTIALSNLQGGAWQ